MHRTGVHRTGVVGVVLGVVAGAVVALGAVGSAPAGTGQPPGTESVQAAADIFLEIGGIKGECCDRD